jgi:lipopolysaccharide biosynthesis regulator YciM
MFGIIGKIKSYIIGGLLLALPVIYALGTLLGRKAAQHDRIVDANTAANDAADFYKRMAEHEGDHSISNRSDLIDRLRKDGL